jgi:hypothetical protein
MVIYERMVVLSQRHYEDGVTSKQMLALSEKQRANGYVVTAGYTKLLAEYIERLENNEDAIVLRPEICTFLVRSSINNELPQSKIRALCAYDAKDIYLAQFPGDCLKTELVAKEVDREDGYDGEFDD